MEQAIKEAQSCLGTLRGEVIFMCSDQKRLEVIETAKFRLHSLIMESGVTLEDLNITQEELDRLYEVT